MGKFKSKCMEEAELTFTKNVLEFLEYQAEWLIKENNALRKENRILRNQIKKLTKGGRNG
jgi:regulator of replication initiation timing